MHVQRYPGAVTWFSPGSFTKRPPLQTSLPNLVCAGDWVRMGSREHGAKGLCQERAYVSGIEVPPPPRILFSTKKAVPPRRSHEMHARPRHSRVVIVLLNNVLAKRVLNSRHHCGHWAAHRPPPPVPKPEYLCEYICAGEGIVYILPILL